MRQEGRCNSYILYDPVMLVGGARLGGGRGWPVPPTSPHWKRSPRHTQPQVDICGWLRLDQKNLKVLTNEKRGGLTVISFDRSPFKLFSRKFAKESVQAQSCERHKTTQRNLFLLFTNNNWFPITLLCLAAAYFSHRKLNWNIGIVRGEIQMIPESVNKKKTVIVRRVFIFYDFST